MKRHPVGVVEEVVVENDRDTARVVGGLFIIGTVAGGLGLTRFEQPVVDASDYLTKASLHEDQVATGVLLTLVMGVVSSPWRW